MTRKAFTREDTTALQRQRAKAMRVEMTDAERRLWNALRTRLPVSGSHFRRQVAIGPYIADFCSFSAKLIIEVDGEQHGFDRLRAYDERRTAYLTALGYRVLRFFNGDITRDLDVVIETIFAALNDAPTPHPSPQGGGERRPA